MSEVEATFTQRAVFRGQRSTRCQRAQQSLRAANRRARITWFAHRSNLIRSEVEKGSILSTVERRVRLERC